MAENKKSFILYADLIHTARKLPKAKQAELFMAILGYVNDENPEVKDLVVSVAFEPIKLQLKRDLKRWEKTHERRSEAGKKGMETRWKSKGSITSDNGVMKPITKITDTVTVNDTVNVTVTEREITPKDFWDLEADKKFTPIHCMTVAMRDEKWVRLNKTSPEELDVFNDYLERTGDNQKTFLDYKKHFSNLKAKYPEKLKKILSNEELRQMANEMSNGS